MTGETFKNAKIATDPYKYHTHQHHSACRQTSHSKNVRCVEHADYFLNSLDRRSNSETLHVHRITMISNELWNNFHHTTQIWKEHPNKQ